MRIALVLTVLLAACGGKKAPGGPAGTDPSKCKPTASGCDPACIATVPLGPDDSGSEGLFEAGATALALADGTMLLAEERWTPEVDKGILLVHAAADGHTLDENDLGPGAAPHLTRAGSRILLAYAAANSTSLELATVDGVKVSPLAMLDEPGGNSAIESIQAVGSDILVSASSSSGTSLAWRGSDGKKKDGWFTFPRNSTLPAAVAPTATGAMAIYEDAAAQQLAVVLVTRASGSVTSPGQITSGIGFGPISAMADGTGFMVVTSKQSKLTALRIDASGKLLKQVSPAGSVVATADGFHTSAGYFAVASSNDNGTSGPIMFVWQLDPELAKALPLPARLPLGVGRLLAFDASGGDYDIVAQNEGGPVRVHGTHCYAP